MGLPFTPGCTWGNSYRPGFQPMTPTLWCICMPYSFRSSWYLLGTILTLNARFCQVKSQKTPFPVHFQLIYLTFCKFCFAQVAPIMPFPFLLPLPWCTEIKKYLTGGYTWRLWVCGTGAIRIVQQAQDSNVSQPFMESLVLFFSNPDLSSNLGTKYAFHKMCYHGENNKIRLQQNGSHTDWKHKESQKLIENTDIKFCFYDKMLNTNTNTPNRSGNGNEKKVFRLPAFISTHKKVASSFSGVSPSVYHQLHNEKALCLLILLPCSWNWWMR